MIPAMDRRDLFEPTRLLLDLRDEIFRGFKSNTQRSKFKSEFKRDCVKAANPESLIGNVVSGWTLSTDDTISHDKPYIVSKLDHIVFLPALPYVHRNQCRQHYPIH